MRCIGDIADILSTQHTQSIDQLKGEPQTHGNKCGNGNDKQEDP